MISDSSAKKILKTYGEAWVKQDTKKILSIFAKDGIYHERVLKKPFIGHKEIKNDKIKSLREYWHAEQSPLNS